MKHSDLKRFPEIGAGNRVLILAPHIDDEIISSSGIIQQAKKKQAQVCVVYATNGDGTPYTIVRKLLRSDWFVSFGKKRMAEARKATSFFGLSKENLIFLGYPDNGLKTMFNNPAVFISGSTKLNYNPYPETYRQKQLYTGENLIKDLANIMIDFRPTMAIVPHLKDNHSDHQFLFKSWQKAVIKSNLCPSQYAYLVHFKSYPPKRGWLQPPVKLASSNRWHSFDLSPIQRQKKLDAVKANASQLKRFSARNLLKVLVRQNEIFEKVD